MKIVVVIPATAGREANLEVVLASLRDQLPRLTVVVVDDGGELDFHPEPGAGVVVMRRAKHEPGMEQPRNAGVRFARRYRPTHVWFVDSDVVIVPGAMHAIERALLADPNRVLVCPYDWLPPGLRPPRFWLAAQVVHNDPRWPMFNASPPERVYRDDLSAGLACFSGNLVWPVSEFERVGGFWSEIHHGRCEDGELGLRAVAMQVPISLVAEARGFHLYHDVNHALHVKRNRRDVPMLNARHPWVEGADVFLSERDGAAFDVRCKCGDVIATGLWWQHAADCPSTGMELSA